MQPRRHRPRSSGSAAASRSSQRKRARPPLNPFDRLFWTTLRRIWSRWTDVLVIVKPETVVGWHHAGFRLYWRWRSRRRKGRPKITNEIRDLIRRLAEENPDWGAPKIHGELQMLGFVVSERSVARYLRRIRRRGDPGKRWLAFLQNHREVICVRLLHRANNHVPIALLLLRHRSWTAQDPSLQHHTPSNCGVGCPAIA